MDETDTQPKGANPRARRWIASAALLAGGVLAGGILAGSQVANAQGATPAASGSAATTWPAGSGVSPADMRHGPGETLLTGATANKVKAAALDAVPGGTVMRVETDSEGSPYEAHIEKSDGSFVTVKIDQNFNVTDTIAGFGPGPMQPGTSN